MLTMRSMQSCETLLGPADCNEDLNARVGTETDIWEEVLGRHGEQIYMQ